jgi:AcrR family transcriptional regulator
MSAAERKKERKTKEIATAAKELFEKFGYKSVSMDSIAERADVAKGTLYLYFKDKESLFNYLVQEFIAGFDVLLKKIEGKNLALADEIVEVVYNLLLYRKSQKFMYQIMTEAREMKTAIARNGVSMIDEQIAAYLKRRLTPIFKGNTLNTEIMSFVIIKIYSALAFEWEETHEPLDARAISQSVGIILKGLLPAGNSYMHKCINA